MFTYFKMKIMEWKIKTIFYGMILGIVDNQKDIIELIQKMYVSLKDIPMNDFREEFMTKLAEVIHEENMDSSEE